MIRFRKVRNVEGVVAELWKNWRGTMGAADRGARKAAELVYQESQRLVPVDTGALKESGRVEKRKTFLKFKTTWMVTYDMRYAIYVHEDLTVFHEPPTQAKYVEQPLRDNQARIKKMIQDEIDQQLRRNKRKKGRGK